MKLKDVPLGCFFTHHGFLCYKDNPTIGTDTNYCVVNDSYIDRPKFWLNRGYCTDSNKFEVLIVDERFIPQLSLF